MYSTEELALNGALTLLTYFQCSHIEHTPLEAASIAAMLCEMLNQLEERFPGVVKEYGWTKVSATSDNMNYFMNINGPENKSIHGDRE